jgi:hypothetical protein
MNESSKFESAEKTFLLNQEAFEVRVHRFIQDPVSVLSDIRQEFIAAADTYEDFDIIGETFVLIDEYKEFMHEHDLVSTNVNLSNYFDFGSYTPEGDAGLFELLRDAGYEKEEICQFLLIGQKDMPDEDRFMVRQSLAVLERVYGNN